MPAAQIEIKSWPYIRLETTPAAVARIINGSNESNVIIVWRDNTLEHTSTSPNSAQPIHFNFNLEWSYNKICKLTVVINCYWSGARVRCCAAIATATHFWRDQQPMPCRFCWVGMQKKLSQAANLIDETPAAGWRVESTTIARIESRSSSCGGWNAEWVAR